LQLRPGWADIRAGAGRLLFASQRFCAFFPTIRWVLGRLTLIFDLRFEI
jgi:hypothetical protein